MKGKFSGAAIKGFFVQHGEKFVVGIAVIALGMFTLNALGKPTLDPSKSEDKLKAAAVEADQNIGKTAYQPLPIKPIVDEPVKVPDQLVRIEPVLPLRYPPKPKRSDPTPFAVDELRAVGGAGPFAMAGTKEVAPAKKEDEPKGGKKPRVADPLKDKDKDKPRFAAANASIPVEGKRFIIVTGAVPVAKQTAEFKQRLQAKAAGDPKDTTGKESPYYGRVKIYRAIAPSESTPESDLQFVELKKDIAAERAKWAQDGGEVVVADSVNKILTWPLPPVLKKTWTPEEAGHPLVKSLEVAAPTGTNGSGPSIAPGGYARSTTIAPATGGPNIRGASPEGGEEPFDPEAPEKPVTPKQTETAPVDSDVKQSATHLLFRYVDLDVEPGKIYRYRVEVGMRNPNYGEPPSNLEKPEVKQVAWLYTPLSKASPPAMLPPDTRVLAMEVKPATNLTKETTAKVAVDTFSIDKAVEAIKEFEPVSLCQIINYVEKADVIPAHGGEAVEMEAFAFKTNQMLIDMRGGEPITPRDELREPGELLLVDTKGNLTVQRETEDRPIAQEKLDIVNPPKVKAAEGGDDPLMAPASDPRYGSAGAMPKAEDGKKKKKSTAPKIAPATPGARSGNRR